MKFLGSTGSFLWALLLILLAFICIGNSFKQELWFYDAQGNGIYFQSHVADISDHSLFLRKVTRVCTRGMWLLFSKTNFTKYFKWPGSPDARDIDCARFTDGAYVESLRHLGANDTDTDALSLYEGSLFNETEILVTSQAYLGIKNPIKTLAGTGTADWMLFEGMNLDGKSKCFQVPCCGWYLNYDYVGNSNLTTVGSVFKGCDVQEIENYKTLHKSEFLNSN